ncbi:putative outer membrane protein [Helicobacter heilmannii]|nr:putative outer membrane protein [Helicobacter heilmannii]
MHKWFLPLVIGGSTFLTAHPKDGFFVEGGFITGLLETKGDIKEKPPCPLGTICIEEIMQNAAPTFTQGRLANIKNPITFNTTQPVKMQLKNGKLQIESFLPYNLHNVDLYMKNANGQEVKVGLFKDIPQFTQSVVAEDLLPAIAKAGGNANSTFSLAPSSSSDPVTTQVLNNLAKITVDIQGTFKSPYPNPENPASKNWSNPPTPKEAEELAEIFLNLTAMLSSPQFKQAVLNAPFEFTNGPGNVGPYHPNVIPGPNGQVPHSLQKYVLNKQKVYEQYTSNKRILIDTLSPHSPYDGLGSPAVFGIQEYLINPAQAKILMTDSLNDDATPLALIMHEFGHVNGFNHNGNMTYPNGSYSTPGGKVEHNCSACTYYKIGDKYVRAGMGGVGENVWTELGKAGRLPINYNQLASQAPPSMPPAFLRVLQNILSANNSANSAMVGFDLMGGYQRYFNDYFGLSYYGIIKYNYAKRMGIINTINQIAFGWGMDALIDFKTNYTTYRIHNKKKRTYAMRKFKSSYGMFVGFRALWKGYGLKGAGFFNSGNLNLDVGFNYRYKHSKYSIGIALPLVQQNLVAKINTSNLVGTFTIQEGVSHFNILFNYGWVF